MVQLGEQITVRPYARRDLTPLRNLTFYNYRVHTHLDWQSVYDYLHTNPPRLWVAMAGESVVGVVGLSEPLGGYSWVRLLAIADKTDADAVVRALWSCATDALRAEGATYVTMLLTREWVAEWTASLGFTYIEDIVTLRYLGGATVAPAANPEICSAGLAEVPTIYDIDAAAFRDPWRLTRQEVRLGVRVGTYSTVAYHEGVPVGYQIATTHGLNGHLARLAVLPGLQGRGVGGALLADMMRYFRERDVNSITVNTQASNVRSQHLYERFGFERNGFDLPVWTLTL